MRTKPRWNDAGFKILVVAKDLGKPKHKPKRFRKHPLFVFFCVFHHLARKTKLGLVLFLLGGHAKSDAMSAEKVAWALPT